MPIEIKELHIKINVDESSTRSTNDTPKKKEIDRIVETCVEQVMEIISKKQER